MTTGLAAYAALCFGLAFAATSYLAPNFAKAITNAALICAVGALLLIFLPMLGN
jgi:hypothetical protein